MRKITAEVNVAHCSLTEQWVIVVSDEDADALAADPQSLLDYDGPIDITNGETDNEEERDVNANMFEVEPYTGPDEDLPLNVAQDDAVLTVRAQAWHRASEDLESAAERFIRSYVKHRCPNAKQIDLTGDYVFNEATELRVHITQIHNQDGSMEMEDLVEEIDSVLEGALMYLASTSGDDYVGDHEMEV